MKLIVNRILLLVRQNVGNDHLGITSFTISNPVLELENGNSSSAVDIATEVSDRQPGP